MRQGRVSRRFREYVIDLPEAMGPGLLTHECEEVQRGGPVPGWHGRNVWQTREVQESRAEIEHISLQPFPGKIPYLRIEVRDQQKSFLRRARLREPSV
jgi:hypothetical protein